MKKIFTLPAITVGLFIAILSLPLEASAQVNVSQGLGTLGGLVDAFTKSILNSLITLFATAAMVAFFYGIVQFIWGSREGKPDVITKGRDFMVWGLVSLFVMFSVWGIIKFGQGVFGIQGNASIQIPKIELKAGSSYTAPSDAALPVNVGGECASLSNGSSCRGGIGSCQNGSCIVSTGLNTSSQQPQQTVYYCPDGVTKYYNVSDAKFCPQTASSANVGMPPAYGSSCVTSQGLSGQIGTDGVCYSLN